MSDPNLYVTNTAFVNIKPSYTMIFSNDKGVVGKLGFNGPVLVFTGDADEGAKLFITAVKQWFHGRMQWVGLTDAEFDAINPKLSLFQFHKAVEAKLKEKNT